MIHQFLHVVAKFKLARYFRFFYVLLDLILLNIAILVSLLMRFQNFNNIALKEVQTISLLSNIFWIFFLVYKDSYRVIRIEKIGNILSKTLKMVVFHAAAISFFVFLLKYNDISRMRMFYFYGVFFVLLFIFRIAVIKSLKYIRSKGFNYKSVIIIGSNARAKQIVHVLLNNLSYGYKVLGFFDDADLGSDGMGIPYLGKIDTVKDYVAANDVDEMYIAFSAKKSEKINGLIQISEQFLVRIKFIPDFQAFTKSKIVTLDFYDHIPVLMLRSEPLESGMNRLLKKIFDLFFSVLVIVFVFSWLFPILIILIKLDSPGPVFFKQQRSGRDLKIFTCYKFRTMHVGLTNNNSQAKSGDPRVTRLGAFLRKFSIDELPQFFNVLLGNMSVVGPRPHMLKHTEHYAEVMPHYPVRHYAKPGITGWAQINGFRGETPFLEDMINRVEHDIWYIENWVFYLDIKIIFKTIFNLLRGEQNAY